ncbi:MAG: hypothetical protein ACQETB_11230 [Halobacteriota archaeon]
MNRRHLLSVSAICLSGLSGCVTARRTGTLVFDPMPPDRPEACPLSRNLPVEFPVPLEDPAVEDLVDQYERALQSDNGVDPDRLSIDTTLTSWGQSYIADLSVTIGRGSDEELSYSVAYYVDENQLLRTATDGGGLAPDPREGEHLECRQRQP